METAFDDLYLPETEDITHDFCLPETENTTVAWNVDPQWNQAQFLLRSAKQLSLAHSGVTDMCESTRSFVESINQDVYKKVIRTLDSHKVTLNDDLKSDLLDSCMVKDLFDGLSTRASRESYFRKNFHYVVSYM